MGRKEYRYRNLVYLAAALWLLMTGICLDYDQAYSISASRNTVVSHRASLSSAGGITLDEICTARPVDLEVVLKENVSSGSRSGHRFGPERLLVCPGSFFLIFHSFFQCVCRKVQQKIHSHTVIMEYIHSKDGRKSRSLL